MRNFRFVIEGPDGVGKSTIGNMVRDFFDHKDRYFISTSSEDREIDDIHFEHFPRENSDFEYTDDPRSLLHCFQHYYSEFEDHSDMIHSSDGGTIWLCDRFTPSTTCYQGGAVAHKFYGQSRLNECITSAEKCFYEVEKQRDILTTIFLLTCKPEERKSRITQRGEQYDESFEKHLRNSYYSYTSREYSYNNHVTKVILDTSTMKGMTQCETSVHVAGRMIKHIINTIEDSKFKFVDLSLRASTKVKEDDKRQQRDPNSSCVCPNSKTDAL